MGSRGLLLLTAIACEIIATGLLKRSDGMSRPWPTVGMLVGYWRSATDCRWERGLGWRWSPSVSPSHALYVPHADSDSEVAKEVSVALAALTVVNRQADGYVCIPIP